MPVKIQVFFLITFFFITSCVFGQNKTIDSLIALAEKTPTKDTNQLKLLNDIALKIYPSNPTVGLKYAQKAVSLAEQLNNNPLRKAEAYKALGINQYVLNKLTEAGTAFQQSLSLYLALNNQQGIASNYSNIGNVFLGLGQKVNALEFYEKSLSITEKIGDNKATANNYANVGNIYYSINEYDKSLSNYAKSLSIQEQLGNTSSQAGILNNIGNVYTQLKDFQKALLYKNRALHLNEKLGDKFKIANSYYNIGNVHIKLKDYYNALECFTNALDINEQISNKIGKANCYNGIAEAYYNQQKFDEAIECYSKALLITSGNTASEEQVKAIAYEKLSMIYVALKDFEKAYTYYKLFVTLQEKTNQLENEKKITQKTMQYEFSKLEDSLKQQQLITSTQLQKQIYLSKEQEQAIELQKTTIALNNFENEVQRLELLKKQSALQTKEAALKENAKQLTIIQKEKQLQQTQLKLKDTEIQSQHTKQLFYLIGLVVMIVLSVLIFKNYTNQRKTNALITKEKQKSDQLLLNILPEEIAEELKQKGVTKAKKHENVTVLFTDFVNFTAISEQLSAEELVSEIDIHFKAFDSIMGKYNIEKIKTIGDAYMAVAGLPIPHALHAVNAIKAAMEMQEHIEQFGVTKGNLKFRMRVGIHSGAVVAGIVGTKKFAYDIWGDSVNTAARMEQNGEAGKINISGITNELVKNTFKTSYRGKIAAKNKGEIDMYFVEDNNI